jgi:LAO/AO transport system kinase
MDVVNVMDAMGMDVIIVETVGVGQDEVDIVSTAHTTVVVMVPGMGDDIQAIKAGILEIGDVFVVNKADRDGADRTARELSAMLEMKHPEPGAWQPHVLKTEGNRGEGISEMVQEFEAHREWLKMSGTLQRLIEERNAKLFADTLREELFETVFGAIRENGKYREILAGLRDRTMDPYTAVEEVLAARAFP